MPSAVEELARLRVALKIADSLQAAGITSGDVSMANPGTPKANGKDSPDWKLAAQAAGLAEDYCPGTLTQRVVIQLLMDREMAAARLKRGEVMRRVNKVERRSKAEADYGVDNMLREDRALRGER